MTTTDNRYFAFCIYDSHYPHQAIFCPLASNPEIERKVKRLCRIFPAHIDVPIIHRNNESKYYAGLTNLTSKRTSKIINYWTGLTIQLNSPPYDEKDELAASDTGIIPYYINDSNRFNSPRALHQKLNEMDSIEGKSIDVIGCVMVSDVMADYAMPVTLQFFAKAKPDTPASWIEFILSKDKKMSKVQVASDNKIFAGYGYVTLDDPTYADVLLTNQVVFDSTIEFVFARH